MTEPKHIYVESNGCNNWCSTERVHKNDVEYISVEWLKSTINEHQFPEDFMGRLIVYSDILLNLIEE